MLIQEIMKALWLKFSLSPVVLKKVIKIENKIYD